MGKVVLTVDKIILRDMEFYGYHGVLEEETRLGQKFIIDLEMGLDLKKAGKSDNRADTVSYADVFTVVRDIVEGRPRKLVEAVAEDIAAAILNRFSIHSLTVRVKKPSAPVPGHFGFMAVEINRQSGEIEYE